jgi:hypothetical protein
MAFEKFLEFVAECSKILSSGVVGVIIGYLFKTQIDHRLAVARNFEVIRANEFNKAAATFRVTFLEQMYSLRKNAITGEIRVSHILDDSVWALHEKAKIMFEPFLEESTIVGFNTAWKKYQDTEDYHDKAMKQGFIPKCNYSEDIFRRQLSQFYLDHIYELLEFAKPKMN